MTSEPDATVSAVHCTIGSNAAVETQDPIQLTHVSQPSRMDVLPGRTKGARRHHGNTAFREMVKTKQSLYAASSRSGKMSIATSIVERIRANGGRFLDYDQRGGVWNDIGEKNALLKTTQALREGQPKTKRKIGAMLINKNDKKDPTFHLDVVECETSSDGSTSQENDDRAMVDTSDKASRSENDPPDTTPKLAIDEGGHTDGMPFLFDLVGCSDTIDAAMLESLITMDHDDNHNTGDDGMVGRSKKQTSSQVLDVTPPPTSAKDAEGWDAVDIEPIPLRVPSKVVKGSDQPKSRSDGNRVVDIIPSDSEIVACDNEVADAIMSSPIPCHLEAFGGSAGREKWCVLRFGELFRSRAAAVDAINKDKAFTDGSASASSSCLKNTRQSRLGDRRDFEELGGKERQGPHRTKERVSFRGIGNDERRVQDTTDGSKEDGDATKLLNLEDLQARAREDLLVTLRVRNFRDQEV